MDADKIHRWITQAELDAMLEAARQEGQQQAIEDSPTLSQYRDAIHAAKMLEDEARTAYQRGKDTMREYLADYLPRIGLPLSTSEIIRSVSDPEVNRG